MSTKQTRKKPQRKHISKQKILVKENEIDYKNVDLLRRFITSRFKLVPRKNTGISAKHQKKMTREIKKARLMGLLPHTDRHAV